jgi:NADH:ubiquinone oxidoreductase subunit 3 (subunit A)
MPSARSVEFVILVVVAVVVLAVGVRVGMLLAPRVERMADRANRFDTSPDAAADADAPAQPIHEDDHDRTD